MKHSFSFLNYGAAVVLLALGLSACEHSTTTPQNPIPIPASTRTLLVVNEGNFGKTNSTMDAILFRDSSSHYDTTHALNVLTGMGEGNDVLVVGNEVFVID